MTSERRYFVGEPCPTDPDRHHMIAVEISSTVPCEITYPTATDADVEYPHWCQPSGNSTSPAKRDADDE